MAARPHHARLLQGIFVLAFLVLIALAALVLGPAHEAAAQTPEFSNTDEDRSGDISEGDTLTYRITATNTGNVLLTNVVVTDVLSGDTQRCASLNPGSSCVLLATYVVLRADVASGRISTTANARSDQTGTVPLATPASLSLPIPRLTLAAGAATNLDDDGSGDLSAGDRLTYPITATNTGSANLTNVTVAGGGSPCPLLTPRAVCTGTGTYTVTARDADAGGANLPTSASSRQTGTVTGLSPMTIPQRPALQIFRTGLLELGADGVATPGDTLRISLRVVNTGNVALANVLVNDADAGVRDCPIPLLAAGAADETTCAGTRRLTQEDIDAGTQAGKALAVAQAASQTVTAESQPVASTLAVPRVPRLTVDRSVVENQDRDGSGGVSDGDFVTFEAKATNAGNMTLTNVRVGDRLTGDESACPRLAPAATCLVSFGYGVREPDVSNGIANLAYATSDQTGEVRPVELQSEVAGVRLPANFLIGVPGVSDVSTDVAVIGTNLTLALVALATLLVATTVFNSTLEENAAGIEAMLFRASNSQQLAPVFAALGWVTQESSGTFRLLNYVKPVVLIIVTALIYALLEPDFGFNEETALVVVALVAGIAVATLLYEGGQVLWAATRYDTPGTMRVYPLALLIALACVALTRFTNLHPGVIFGFVTAAVVYPRRELTLDQRGRIVATPLAALLATSLVAFLLIDPLRDFNLEHATLWSALPETIAVAVFVGGAQSALLTLIPVNFNDGEKVWQWSKFVWFALAVPAAFGFFHVLINEEHYGELAKNTSAITLLAVCGGVVAISIGTWLYFNVRRRSQSTA